MRRPLTALVGAAVLAAALLPAAAGAADSPKRRPHLRLACEVVRHDQLPAVACKWSGPDRIMAAANQTAINDTAAANDTIAPDSVVGDTPGPGLAGFRLWRAGRFERPHVVYRGKDQSHIDATVRQGRRYGFRVEALDSRGRTIARSNVARVKIPTLPLEALKLDCKVVDLPWAAAQDVVRPIPIDRQAVACEWSKSQRRDFAAYRLFRAPGKTPAPADDVDMLNVLADEDSPSAEVVKPENPRKVIYRGDAQRYLDTDVRPGQRYRYLVQSVNHWGLPIGHSDVVHVGVPPHPGPAATFEQALRSLPSFQWKGGGFGPWLFRIAANQLVDHYRTEQRTRGLRANRPLGRLEAPPSAAGFDEVDDAFGSERILACLATLNPRYQKAISLRYLAGLSSAEAAEAIGSTKPVLAVTLHRALAALRRALENEDAGGGPRLGQGPPVAPR